MKKSFNVFKSNFLTIFILFLMIVLPVYLIQEFLLTPYAPEIPDNITTENIASQSQAYTFDSKTLWYFAGMLIVNLFSMLYKIGVIKLSYSTLESSDLKLNVNEIMDFSMRLWPKTILTTFVYAIFVAFGFMLFFFPGMMMLALYYFYIQVVVIYGIWGRPSFAVSTLYARKMLNKTITIVLINIAFPYCISFGTILLQRVIHNEILSHIVAFAVFFFGQLILTFLDIFATVCVHDTALGVDINIFKKKKDQNVQR